MLELTGMSLGPALVIYLSQKAEKIEIVSPFTLEAKKGVFVCYLKMIALDADIT